MFEIITVAQICALQVYEIINSFSPLIFETILQMEGFCSTEQIYFPSPSVSQP
jgi:hypothetical protein